MIIVAMNTEKTRMGAMGVNVDARNAEAGLWWTWRNIAHVASQYALAPPWSPWPLGKLRLGGRPLVVEDEAVVGADADEHEQPDEVEKREIRDPQNHGGEKHRRREREEHLEHTAESEQRAPRCAPI